MAKRGRSSSKKHAKRVVRKAPKRKIPKPTKETPPIQIPIPAQPAPVAKPFLDITEPETKPTEEFTLPEEAMISHNKALMIPPKMLTIPEKEKGFSLFKRKKEENEIMEEETEIPEPEVLKEIDLEKHAHHTKIEPELSLWLDDGRTVRSLAELSEALRTMSSRTFATHLEKKDIPAWIEDLFGNKDIAIQMQNAKTKMEAVKILEKNRQYEKPEKAPQKPHEEKRAEIQKAVEELHIPKEPTTAEEKEEAIIDEERALEQEEEYLNKKRLELTNRRYILIKKRGELEKEKFQKILSGKIRQMPESAVSSGLSEEFTEKKLQDLLEEAKRSFSTGNMERAKGLVIELKNSMEMTPSAIRDKKMEYDVLALEADIKLAALA